MGLYEKRAEASRDSLRTPYDDEAEISSATKSTKLIYTFFYNYLKDLNFHHKKNEISPGTGCCEPAR